VSAKGVRMGRRVSPLIKTALRCAPVHTSRAVKSAEGRG
jgi:hypothetical protein